MIGRGFDPKRDHSQDSLDGFGTDCNLTSRGAGRALPGFGIMLDQKIPSVRKLFYFRAGYLDAFFSVGFNHELSEIFRFWGCLK